MTWATKSLAQLCSPRRELQEPTTDGANRYVGLEHLEPGWITIQRWGSDRDVRSTKSRFNRGDVLYGKLRPYLDKAALAEWEGVCSTDILTLQPDLDEADPKFVAFLLHTGRFLGHAIATTSGVNHPRTSWQEISRFSCDVPLVPEQRAIAGVLAEVQRAVEVEDRRIAALKELKAATMAKVFREGLRGEPLKATEIGQMPRTWNVIPLGSGVRTAQYGLSVRGESTGRVPILRMNCQHEGRVVFRDLQYVQLDERSLRHFRLQDGDLLFNRTNSFELVGRTALFTGDREAVFASYLIRLQVDPYMFIPAFLNHYLNLESVQQAIKSLATRGVSQSNISASKLRTFYVPKPPLPEQREIAETIDTLAISLGACQRRREVRDQLFQSTLQQLMTGQLRVTPLFGQEEPPHA